jgi:hypothetical protein
MKRFNYTKMRRTFYEWHGGQYSPLYAAASSGIVADVGALQSELTHCAESLWTRIENFKGPRDYKTMRAPVYDQWQYLRAVSDALPVKNGRLPGGGVK